MVANKHISKIIIAVMAAAVALCFLAIAVSGELTELMGGSSVKMEYESKLFNTDEVIEIDIQMDEDSWEQMLSNAMSEEYYVCNVVINGQKVNNVAIRPKGNTSLSAIAMDPETDRYSLKLEFDHFVKGQTCYGLDKLILNNNYADATNMKEAIIYDMFQYIGAEASLYNYAKVSVNGEYWGVYLALEAVEQSFMLRNLGTQDGELYKPDSMEMGGGKSSEGSSSGGGLSMPDMGNFSMPDMGDMDFSDLDMSEFEGMTPPDGGSFSFGGMTPPPGSGFSMGGSGSGDSSSSGDEASSNNDVQSSGSDAQSSGGDRPSGEFGFDPENMPDMGSFDSGSMPDMGSFDTSNIPNMGGFSMGASGANLNYTDDDLDSYSTIWEGAVTGTSKADHRRVVTALKNISEGTDLETYLDVDNVLKYMAVHTFSVNMDSLSGSMAHNYYLYEYDGQLNILPWDYNLSLGGMSMGSSGGATGVVNDPIDTPFSGTRFFNALLENEEYLERYHAYLQQLVDEYVNSCRFDEVYNRIRNQIDELVDEDPTAFYPYDEYETAAEYLYETIKLRAESIEGQLDGTIPSTDAGQSKDSSALIDASHIDIKAMGQFNMGGSFESDSDFGRSSRIKNRWGRPGDRDGSDGAPEAPGDQMPGEINGQMPDGFDPSDLPEDFSFDSSDLPEDFSSDGEGMPDMGNFDPENMPNGGGFSPGNMPNGGSFNFDGEGRPDMGDFDPENMPNEGGFSPGNMPNGGNFNFDGEGMPDMNGSAPSENEMPSLNNNDTAKTPAAETPEKSETSEKSEAKDKEDAKDRVELNWADPSDKPDTNDKAEASEQTDAQEKPDVQAKDDTQAKADVQPEDNAQAETEVQAKDDAPSDASAAADGERTRPSSFSGMSGMPGQSSSQAKTKNLITYGICLAVMIVALIALKLWKRR